MAGFLPGLHAWQQRRPLAGGAGRRGVPPTRQSSTASSRRSVHDLIRAYRTLGHLQAHLDPLSPPPPLNPKLQLLRVRPRGSRPRHLLRHRHLPRGGQMKLRDIVAALQETYCGHVGVEYAHIQDRDCLHWLQERIESTRLRPRFSNAQKGAHPAPAAQGRAVREVPAHEVRRPEALFPGGRRDDHRSPGCRHRPLPRSRHRGDRHGHGAPRPPQRAVQRHAQVLRPGCSSSFPRTTSRTPSSGDGDVKYHLGYESVLTTSGGRKVEVRLAANPSHLEIIGPVVEGKARARLRIRGDIAERRRVLPLIIHGDAALAGQGVVAETLNFSQLVGYRTGGTLHLVINNQIGFTTDPIDARSSHYCTDVAKMIEAPIFHVNGDDPEAVCMVGPAGARLPRPLEARRVRRHGLLPPPRPQRDRRAVVHPADALPQDRGASPGLVDLHPAARAGGQPHRRQGRARSRPSTPRRSRKTSPRRRRGRRRRPRRAKPGGPLQGLDRRLPAAPTTMLPSRPPFPPTVLGRIARTLTTVPEDFKPHPKIKRLLAGRAQACRGRRADRLGLRARRWPSARCSLEDIAVRLSGQDCERGTFSHRHAVLADVETGGKYIPLKNLDAKQAYFCVYNSLLSEAAVLGFDYGYAMDYPDMLCLWEAQFGDFSNGAQVVIDQFIVSGESKWQTHLRHRPPAAARLRGPGPGALLRAPRALPAGLRRGQHPGRQPDDAGPVLSRPAPAGEAQLPQAAGHHGAQVAPAPSRRRPRRWRS